MKNFRGYIFSRPFFGERAPQHIQNQIIRDFCEKKEFNYLLSSVEYAVNKSNLMLKKILNENGIKCKVFPSNVDEEMAKESLMKEKETTQLAKEILLSMKIILLIHMNS